MLAVLPPGVRNRQKWTSFCSIWGIWGPKCIFQYILSVSRHLQGTNGPGTSPRDAPYPGHIEICASTCFFYGTKVLFLPFESVEHLRWPQTGIWKSRARAEYKNAEIKVSHAWQVHAMPLRNIKLRQLNKWLYSPFQKTKYMASVHFQRLQSKWHIWGGGWGGESLTFWGQICALLGDCTCHACLPNMCAVFDGHVP